MSNGKVSLSELFIADNLTEQDMANNAYTISDKVRENQIVIKI